MRNLQEKWIQPEITVDLVKFHGVQPAIKGSAQPDGAVENRLSCLLLLDIGVGRPKNGHFGSIGRNPAKISKWG
jgi:hypothetical protein